MLQENGFVVKSEDVQEAEVVLRGVGVGQGVLVLNNRRRMASLRVPCVSGLRVMYLRHPRPIHR